VKAYLIRRLLLIIPTFIGISVLTFLLIQLAPGSPISFRLQGIEGGMSADAASQEIIEQTRALYGLDKPLAVQYKDWVVRMVRFDFGNSFKDQRPVITKIAEALPITLQLNILSLLLVYVVSIPLGVYSSTHSRSLPDNIITVILFLLFSLPNFWLAMLLILYFASGQHLAWFPITGIATIGAENLDFWPWLKDRVWHMVLPVTVLSVGSFAVISRYMRSGMIEVLRQDYIRTARAYGFSERVVVWKYAMRNSLIPIITLLGTLLPAMIGGSIIVETIFSIPGMGRLAFEAVLSRDYPLIMGNVTIAALLTLVGLLISDLLYMLLDPRIQLK